MSGWDDGHEDRSVSGECIQASILLGTGGNYVISQMGNFTLRDGEIKPVKGRPVLVVSDLDDTMVRMVLHQG